MRYYATLLAAITLTVGGTDAAAAQGGRSCSPAPRTGCLQSDDVERDAVEVALLDLTRQHRLALAVRGRCIELARATPVAIAVTVLLAPNHALISHRDPPGSYLSGE